MPWLRVHLKKDNSEDKLIHLPCLYLRTMVFLGFKMIFSCVKGSCFKEKRRL